MTNNLVQLHQHHHPLFIANPPWHHPKTCLQSRQPTNPVHPILLFTTTTTSWKLHAESDAKGFGAASRKRTNTSNTIPQNIPSNNVVDNEEEIPQAVFQRMMIRILVSVGVPMATGFAMLQVLSIVKERQLWDVPLWVPFLTSFICFGISILGIPFGTLSTSLDPEKEGSLLGIEEAKGNWVEMWKEEK